MVLTNFHETDNPSFTQIALGKKNEKGCEFKRTNIILIPKSDEDNIRKSLGLFYS